MKEGEIAIKRLEHLLIKENSSTPIGFERLICGDIHQLLSCYMKIENESLTINLLPTRTGFDVTISLKATRLFAPKNID